MSNNDVTLPNLCRFWILVSSFYKKQGQIGRSHRVDVRKGKKFSSDQEPVATVICYEISPTKREVTDSEATDNALVNLCIVMPSRDIWYCFFGGGFKF